MSLQNFNLVKEEVLANLVDMNLLDTDKFVNAVSVLSVDESGVPKARLYLLNLLVECASRCERCVRHCQRVNPSVGEGVLDSPMIVSDYPNYFDTLSGRPLSGLPEIFLQRCGSCVHLEKHFKEPFLLEKDMCHYQRNNSGRIELPVYFQGQEKSLANFISPGQVIDRILLDLGETRANWGRKSSVYITNRVLCPSIDSDNNPKPVKAAESKLCKIWLDLQIKIANPNVIICLGTEAYYTFVDKKQGKISEDAGKLQRIPSYENRLVGVTWHPGMVIRHLESDKCMLYYESIKSHIKYFMTTGRSVS